MGKPAPPKLSLTLMARILAWREQVAQVGDLDAASKTVLRKALDDEAGTASSITQARRLKPGTVLTREHAGATHRVMILAKGFAWNGKTFNSLSAVAEAITGTHWNGRKFFGLKTAAAAGKAERVRKKPGSPTVCIGPKAEGGQQASTELLTPSSLKKTALQEAPLHSIGARRSTAAPPSDRGSLP